MHWHKILTANNIFETGFRTTYINQIGKLVNHAQSSGYVTEEANFSEIKHKRQKVMGKYRVSQPKLNPHK